METSAGLVEVAGMTIPMRKGTAQHTRLATATSGVGEFKIVSARRENSAAAKSMSRIIYLRTQHVYICKDCLAGRHRCVQRRCPCVCRDADFRRAVKGEKGYV